MKKKFLALVLTLAMVLSLVPVTALATDGTPTPDKATESVTASQDGVNITKKVVTDAEGNHKLVMEAYVEGTTTETTTSTPLDIVLVLDVSGSMDDPMGKKDSKKRIDALKSAVNAFIDKVAEKNTDADGNTVGHKISIVKFAGEKLNQVGNERYWDRVDREYYNYSQIVKNLTDVDTQGKSDLQTEVNKLTPGGATQANYGMELAQRVLSSDEDSDRDKVVVMFTDGTPTSSSNFEYRVARSAIANSATLKGNNVKVYTVGIFSDANPQADLDGASKTNKYMHAVSSNYPNATLTSTNTGIFGSKEWHWNFGRRAQGSNYYLSATNSTELNNVFQEISDSITHTTVTANASAVLRDTLTEQFVLNGTDENAITVQKAKVTGKIGNTYSWETPENVDVEKAIDGKTVTVKGFNYTSEDNVITENNGVYSGYKLIVTIPIKVDDTYTGWLAGKHYYNTNDIERNKAGLTGYTKDGQEASTLLDTSPNVPVTAYTVTYRYSDNHEGAPSLANYNDGKAYLPGKILSVKPTPNWNGYSFNGWNYPDTIQVTEGKFSVPESNVVITGSWTENEIHINYVALEGGTIQEAETETPQRYSETVGLGQANPQARGATAKPNEGKYFVGWYSDPECTNFVDGQMNLVPTITPQQGDVTYYAKFSDKQTITIQVPNETLTYTGGELTGKSYSDATISPEGYRIEVTGSYKPAEGTTVSPAETTYIGSFDGVTFTVFQGDQDVTSKVNVNAIPGKLHIKGKVTYDANANGATVTDLPQDTDTYFLDADVPVKEGTPKRDGYNFDGWMLSQNGNAVTQGTMGTTGLTFYAKWSEKKVDVNLSQLIQKQLTVKKNSTLPTGTTFNVTVTPEKVNGQDVTSPQPIPGTVSDLGTGNTNADGDTTYTVPFNFTSTLSLSAGTYTYTVQEDATSPISGMQYDSKEYTLTITVNNDSSYTATYATEATTEAKATPLTIQNTYQAPNLTVEKQTVSVAGEPVNNNTVARVNDKIIWSVTVTNEKSTPARVTLTDAMAEGVYTDNKCETPAENVNWNANTHSWTATVSGKVTYYVNYTVKAEDISKGKIVNTIVMKNGDQEKTANSDPVSTWDTKQLKSATSLSTSDWTTTVTLTLPTVNKATDNNTVNPVVISKGSYVIDKIGNEFTFVPELKLTLKVGDTDTTYTGEKVENTDTYNFGTKVGEEYPYTVTYTAKNDETQTPAQFKWEINQDIPAGTTVTLSYKLKLTTPKTATGTYGVTDLDGNGFVDGAETTKVVAADALYTNESAALYKNADTKLAEFPKPSVSYTIKGSSGGHGGNGGGTVTIPDDVPTGLNGKDHYAYVVGYPDGMVYPQKNITRAEVATIFFRLLTDETREANMTKSNSYNDMKDGAWYTCAVSTLSKMGIIKGYEDGSFKPDASISRAEFAAIAARFDPDGDKTPATFSDVSSHWAKDEISIAANHGWIKGYEDGSFKPDQKITRAETMTLVNRVLKRLPETKDDLHKDMKTWPDNQKESAWFYLAVQEATNSHYQKLKKDGTHEKWESMRETRDWAALEK